MNSDDVKVNKLGKILQGKHKNWYIFVKDDFEESGGFLILLSKDADIDRPGEGYDSWAEDFSTVKKIFQECDWQVDWM